MGYTFVIVSCFSLINPGQARYIKDLPIDNAEEEFFKASMKNKNYKTAKREKELRDYLRIFSENQFIDSIEPIVEKFKNPNGETIFNKEVPYTETSIKKIGGYFILTEQEKTTAVDAFKKAILLMSENDSSQFSFDIIRNVEKAAELGYVPAILAYGAMNRYGLFGMSKNIPLATVFLTIAAEAGGDSKAFELLGGMRQKHLMLEEDLKVSPLFREDRIPQSVQFRIAAIGGGNFNNNASEEYLSIMNNNKARRRAGYVRHTSSDLLDRLLVEFAKLGGIFAKYAL